jgi:hypothetical protein
MNYIYDFVVKSLGCFITLFLLGLILKVFYMIFMMGWDLL